MIRNKLQMEHRPCPMGCMNKDDIVCTGQDRLHGLPGEFTIVRCATCGLMRTDPRPSPDGMKMYYPEDYAPYQARPQLNSKFGSIVWIKEKISSIFFQNNTTRLPNLTPGRMLEVGCASGTFLHEMACRGWNVEGIEFSEKAAKLARNLGYSVYAGTLESTPDPSLHYDMIVGWMVLEHLHEPLLCLKKIHTWVRPGGWLVVSVPNSETIFFRIFGSYWFDLHLPNHLYHFTPKTISALFDKAGWNIEKIFHQRVVSAHVVSIGYRLRDRKCLSWLSRWLISFPEQRARVKYFLYPLAYILGVLRQSGRMTVWARKK